MVRSSKSGTGKPKKGSLQSSAQRVNISLPEKLHILAKVIAVTRGMTLADYLEEAIGRAVDKRASELRSLAEKEGWL